MTTSASSQSKQPAAASARAFGVASPSFASPSELIAPRGELFADPTARAIWAAVSALDVGSQHLVLEELERRLRADDVTATDVSRVRRAIDALREASRIAGCSPSVERYRELRVAEPDRERAWPSDGSIRRWLGGSWNEALKRARLETVPDGDSVVRSLGGALSLDEITTALRDCATEIGQVPTLNEYRAWARRPEVKHMPGRRPLSQMPFTRFGGYLPCLRAAGLVADDSLEGVPASTLVRVVNYVVTDEQMIGALREVAARLGRAPRTTQYTVERERIRSEALAGGRLRSLPALSTIQVRYGTWDAALVEAGLEPLGGRGHGRGGPRKGSKAPRVTDEQIRSAIREAFAALGHPFTLDAYKRWRAEQRQRDREHGVFRRLPAYDTFRDRYGTWDAAVKAALAERDDDEEDEGADLSLGDGAARIHQLRGDRVRDGDQRDQLGSRRVALEHDDHADGTDCDGQAERRTVAGGGDEAA